MVAQRRPEGEQKVNHWDFLLFLFEPKIDAGQHICIIFRSGYWIHLLSSVYCITIYSGKWAKTLKDFDNGIKTYINLN